MPLSFCFFRGYADVIYQCLKLACFLSGLTTPKTMSVRAWKDLWYSSERNHVHRSATMAFQL